MSLSIGYCKDLDGTNKMKLKVKKMKSWQVVGSGEGYTLSPKSKSTTCLLLKQQLHLDQQLETVPRIVLMLSCIHFYARGHHCFITALLQVTLYWAALEYCQESGVGTKYNGLHRADQVNNITYFLWMMHWLPVSFQIQFEIVQV